MGSLRYELVLKTDLRLTEIRLRFQEYSTRLLQIFTQREQAKQLPANHSRMC